MTITCETHSQLQCSNCAAAKLCLPMGLEKQQLDKLNHVISKRYTLTKGEVFIRPADPFRNFYAVNKGSLKSYTLDYEGREQIWSLYIIGELFGFEGVDTESFPYYIQALEDTTICEIPYDLLLQLIQEASSLQKQVLKLMSQRFAIDLGLPRNNSSDERLASFLLMLSSRFERRGLSSIEFILPLTRQEIACYLGLTLETVSRIFSKLKKGKILKVEGKRITILSLRELQKIAAN
jgi:CRP/FNR family transcriptional regulator